MRKFSLALAALATVGAVALTPEPASARPWGWWGGPGWYGGWGWRRSGWGWGVGAGLAGFGIGLVTGAALAAPAYTYPAYGYGFYGYPTYGYASYGYPAFAYAGYPVTTTVLYAQSQRGRAVHRVKTVRRVVSR